MSVITNARPGRFRVERDECTSCGTCGVVAPEHFEPGVDGMAYVTFRQPQTAAEVAVCREALACCPFDAIRDQPGSSDGGTTTV